MKQLLTANPNTKEYWDWRYRNEAEDMWRIWTTGDLIERIAERIPNHARVLDVGCGAGIVPTRINKMRTDIRWSACDFSDGAVEYLRALGTVAFERLEVANVCAGLPFDPQEFDAVVATEILEHVDSPTVAVAEMVRVASQRLVVSVPNRSAIPSREHLWEYAEKDLRDLLSPHGRVNIVVARGGRNIIGVCDL